MTPVPPRRSPLYAGIDVGATKIEVVIAGADFTPLAQARIATPLRGGPAAVVTAIQTAVEEALEASPSKRLTAVGIGVPGEVDAATGAVSHSPNIRGWTASFPLRAELESRFDVTCGRRERRPRRPAR